MDNDQGLDNLLAYADIRPAVNQIEVHPLMTQEENIAYNHSLSIQVEGWGPFGQGDIDVIGHPLLQSLAISALNQNLRSNVLNDPETFPW